MSDCECGMGPLSPLFCDLYELTMVAGYYDHDMQDLPTTFEYFYRKPPHNTGFCVFAGLDPLIDDLAGLHFSDSDIKYLASTSLFNDRFLNGLHDFKFTGTVYSPKEGTPVFPYEPAVRVVAPLAQAQIIETLLLCRLNYQTLIATKASRVRYAAQSDTVMEFGLRRAQGPDGGMSGSRAAIIGGCDSTSNTQAGKCFGVRSVGTQAHSWVMAFPTELDAFRAYAKTFPEHLILLVDTYDTLASGVPNAIRVFKEMQQKGWMGRPGIRIDSGDMAKLSKTAHRMLSDAGFPDALIVGSSELDEHLIADIKRQGAHINSWGVGTKLMTGGSEPALSGVYKLSAEQIDGQWVPKFKISDNPEKTTDPGIKMPIRFYDEAGIMAGDVLFMNDDESWKSGEIISYDRTVLGKVQALSSSCTREPLLKLVMQDGRRVAEKQPVMEIRTYAQQEISKIPEETRRLLNPQIYWLGLSERLAYDKRSAIEAFWAAHR